MKTYQKVLLVVLGIPVAIIGIMLSLMVLLFLMNDTEMKNSYIHRKIKPAEIVGHWKLTDKSLYMLDSLHRNITGPTNRIYRYYTKEFVFEMFGKIPVIHNVCYIYANNQFESMVLDTINGGDWNIRDKPAYNTEELSISYSWSPSMQDTTLGTFSPLRSIVFLDFVEKDGKLIMWTTSIYDKGRDMRYEYEKVN